jgi:RND family efflux transporter MFP subunit
MNSLNGKGVPPLGNAAAAARAMTLGRTRGIRPWGRALVLAALPALGAWGCTSHQEGASPDERVVAVGVHTVALQRVATERHWQGRLEPLRTYPVQAPRGGRVASIAVRDGTPVRAGDVLARMDSPDLDARREVLRERVAQMEGELARWKGLQEEGAAGPGEVAEATLRLLEARDQASELEAFAETYAVRAPASGRVNTVVVGPGANVTEGQTLLQVEDDATLGVRLTVPAAETAYLEDVQRLSLRDDRDQVLPVRRVVFSSDAHPAFVGAEVYVEGTGGRRAATVIFRSWEEVLTIPWTAVASDGDRHWVAVVVDGDPARIDRRTVELGRGHGDGIEVRSGLVAGDRIVRYEPRSHPQGRAVLPQEDRTELLP